MEQTLGLYLHIPFCKSKCAYCDFYSLPHSEEKMDAYAAALLRHLEEVAPRCTAHTVDTVYFGGGTPSYLGEKRLTHLLKAVKKRFHVASDAEITLEANPDSAGDWKALRTLRKAGFNRISLGLQAADDDLLRRIGRVHTWEQALSAAAAARMAGFDNLSLDLIYGLPGQTLEAWQDTLRSAAALEPQHLSCYGLKVEPGTPLWQQLVSQGRFTAEQFQAAFPADPYAALHTQSKYRTALAEQLQGVNNVTWMEETSACTTLERVQSGLPHGGYQDELVLVYKAGSQPGEGTVVTLPGVKTTAVRQEAPASIHCKGTTLTYTYRFDKAVQDVHQAGTYTFTVDLTTGNVSSTVPN